MRSRTNKSIEGPGGLLLLVFIGLILAVGISSAQDVSEQDLRDAILGRITETPEMDQNDDGEIDVADLVFLKRLNPVTSIVGEHAGVLRRDGGDLLANLQGSMGQIPFLLQITSESPLAGKIDNTSGDSLYFPRQILTADFATESISDFEFSLSWTESDTSIAPGSDLTRAMTFKADFLDDESRFVQGTYVETIQAEERGLSGTFTGTFVIILQVEVPSDLDGP